MTSGPVTDWLAYNALRRPKHPALIELATGRGFDYAAVAQRVDAVAGFLAARGVGKGDRVAVLARNSTDMLELLFVCRQLGALYLPLNWRLARPELDYIVGDAEPKVLFASPEFSETAAWLAGRTGATLLTLADGGPAADYDRAVADGGSVSAAPLDHDDPWFLIYTSGTTGRPKGAIISYGNVFYNLVSHNISSRLTADSTTLIFGPFFHTGALSAYSIAAIHAGATVAVMRSFDAGAVNAAVSDPALGITHINGAVTMYLQMGQHDSFAEADYSRIVCASISGERAALSLLERYHREKRLPLQNIYGATETGPVLTAQDRDHAVSHRGSIGVPALYTELRLVGQDGRDVPEGAVGEIWARGPNVTPGYWRDSERTAAAFTDGWFRTGDAARRDADGHYYLIDRWKDLYISGGENVYPAEVENVLYQIDGIAEAAVIGVPHPRWGETGLAVVVRARDSELGEDAILRHCRENLASYKVPNAVVFTDLLPRSGGGKVIKPALRDRFASDWERVAARERT